MSSTCVFVNASVGDSVTRAVAVGASVAKLIYLYSDKQINIANFNKNSCITDDIITQKTNV